MWPMPSLSQSAAPLVNPILHNPLVARAAAVLGDVEAAAEAIAVADLAHVDQRVGVARARRLRRAAG